MGTFLNDLSKTMIKTGNLEGILVTGNFIFAFLEKLLYVSVDKLNEIFSFKE